MQNQPITEKFKGIETALKPHQASAIKGLVEIYSTNSEYAVQAMHHVQARVFFMGTTLRRLNQVVPRGHFEAFCEQTLGVPKQTQVRWRKQSDKMHQKLAESTEVVPKSLEALAEKLPKLADCDDFREAFNGIFARRSLAALGLPGEIDKPKTGDGGEGKGTPPTAEQLEAQARQDAFDFFFESFVPQLQTTCLNDRTWERLDKPDRKKLADSLRQSALEIEQSL